MRLFLERTRQTTAGAIVVDSHASCLIFLLKILHVNYN